MEPLTTLALRFYRIFTGFYGLREAIARHSVRHPAVTPIVLLVCARLTRLIARLDRLSQKHQAGTLRAPAPRPASAPREPVAKPGLRLPARRGWLVQMVPAAGAAGGAVHALLQDPEARALVEAAPQAGRLFRPLARMLGVELPEWLRLPKRARKSRAKPLPVPLTPPPAYPPGLLPGERFLPPRLRREFRALGLFRLPIVPGAG